MGIFSSRKKTYVSSVVYNLAGDSEKRENYLKSLLLGSMIGNKNFNVVKTLQTGYLHGNGMKLRGFYRWAENNYDEVGIPQDTFRNSGAISVSAVEAALGAHLSITAKVEWVDSGIGDAAYWALQWMYENLPDRVGDDWTADLDYLVDDLGIVTTSGFINFDDGITDPIPFPVAGYEPLGQYIYVSYQEDAGSSEGSTITGDTVPLGTGAFPSDVSWIPVSDTDTAHSVDRHKTVTAVSTYSDGRPTETVVTETDTPTGYDSNISVLTRINYRGIDPDNRVYSLREYLRLDEDYVLVEQTSSSTVVTTVDGSVTKTTVTTTVEEILTVDREYRIDSQEIVYSDYGPTKIFIYKLNTGVAALDALIEEDTTGDGYFPLIPLRLNNEFISDTNKPDLYAQAKKALKKSISGDFDDIVEKLEDNDNLTDIDFAYIVFGASLNTKENAAKRYIYEFFYRAMGNQGTTAADYQDWEDNEYTPHSGDRTAWLDWETASRDINDDPPTTYHSYVPQPVRPGFSPYPTSSVNISVQQNAINYNVQIDWSSIEESTGTGASVPGAKVGEVNIVLDTTGTLSFNYLTSDESEEIFSDGIKIYWQVTADTWKCLTIVGLVHKNLIWNGKSVEITSTEALSDDDESGFIIPIHAETFKNMSIVDSTQMSTSCAYLLLNCYQIVKSKWYTRGWFKVLLIIAVVVLTILYPPAGVAAGEVAGVLGTAAAVGAALGFTGLMAVIVGTLVNMLAAMIITRLVTTVATAAFGEKWGMIIGTIVSIAMLQVGTAMSTGQDLNTIFASMMRVDNLLQLSNVIGQNIAGLVQMDAQSYAARSAEVMKEYEAESAAVEQLYAENIGYGNSFFDPTMLTEAKNIFVETEDMFLSRTLMTGSEIAELSMEMVNSYVDMTIRTDLIP